MLSNLTVYIIFYLQSSLDWNTLFKNIEPFLDNEHGIVLIVSLYRVCKPLVNGVGDIFKSR